MRLDRSDLVGNRDSEASGVVGLSEVSEPASETDRIFEIISDIHRDEVRSDKEQLRRLRVGRFWLWSQWISLVGIVLAVIIARYFDAPGVRWVLAALIVLSYLGGVAKYVLVGLNWRLFWDTFRRPYRVLIDNANQTAQVDFHHLPELERCSRYGLENVLLEVKAEREFFERRIGLYVGAIEKVGIIPGLLALPSIFKDANWNWVTTVAVAMPFIYVAALRGHAYVIRLDRNVKLLELIIGRKKQTEAT